MIFLYYIGGPWDQSKVARQFEPTSSVLTMREPLQVAHVERRKGSDPVAFAEVKDHRYMVRKIGRETWIAVHEDIA